ncbi:Adenylate kinase 2 [Batrachochytrium dendrobatidis]
MLMTVLVRLELVFTYNQPTMSSRSFTRIITTRNYSVSPSVNHVIHPDHPHAIPSHLNKQRPLRAIIMGCPGAGKGTQTKWLASNYGIRTISSGDVLRSNVLQKTPVGLQAKAIIEAGGLVNDSLVNDLMLTEMKGMSDSQCYVLDGFPRTVPQAEMLDAWLKQNGTPLAMVINLDVPWNVILQRIEDRWIHAPSGRTYNISYNPPLLSGRDDVTGEPLTKRSDDDVDIFKSRLEAYQSQTMPLIGYYTNQGILCNFKGSTSDEIYPQIQDTLHAYYGCSITADTKPAKTCTSTDSTSVSTLSQKPLRAASVA